MRIAIPVSDGLIAKHMGHCPEFLIADIEDGAVKQKVTLPNPGHGPGGPPPAFLAKLGVKQVLAWGMPAHAGGIFNSMGVQVQLGVTGDPGAAIADYLAGSLKLTTQGLDGGGACAHAGTGDNC